MKVDAAIIGGGPAGLKAAIEIAKRGGSVVVLDENSIFGGKLLGQLHEEGKHHWWDGGAIAESIVQEALSAGVQLIGGVQVWGLEAGWKVHLSDVMNGPLQTPTVEAKAVLLATGAVEKPLPVPGWTLPGVMTIGAAQVLTNLYRVKPGHKVIIAGVDVLSLSIARALVLAGVKVEGIVLGVPNEFNREQGDVRQAFAKLYEVSRLAPNRFLRWCGSLLRFPVLQSIAVRFFPSNGLTVWGIPLLLRKALVSIEGKEQVEQVTVASFDASGNLVSGSEASIAVDAVCLSGGLTPLSELAAVAGCKFVRLEGLSGSVPLHNTRLETTADGLFVAGNITGIEGAKVAMAQGALAGKSICAKVGIGNVTERELEIAVQDVKITRSKAEFQFHAKITDARQQLEQFWEKEQRIV